MKILNLNRYVHHSEPSIVCIVIQTDWKWPVIEATGNGDHPCIVIETEEGISKEITFNEYNSDWNVFSAVSMKHGINVTLINEKARK